MKFYNFKFLRSVKMLKTQKLCTYTNYQHLCTPETCTILKCYRVQKRFSNLDKEDLYQLGVIKR